MSPSRSPRSAGRQQRRRGKKGVSGTRDDLRTLSLNRMVEALIGGWRPLARLDVDGFAILRSRGITLRANSTVGLDLPADATALEAAVDRIETLVAASGETPRFRIFDTPEMQTLDSLLGQRGYRDEAHCEVLELALTGAPHYSASPSARIHTGALDENWFEDFWRLAPRDGEGARDTVRDIMAGTPAVQVCIAAPASPDRSIAVGRAALVESGKSLVAVLDAIAVDPDFRRQGHGSAILQTLLGAAVQQGAERALLEVETTNREARRLYQGLHFRRISGYHYRTAPRAESSNDVI